MILPFLVCFSVLLGPNNSGNSGEAGELFPTLSPEVEQRYVFFDTLATDLTAYHYPTEKFLPLTSAFADFRQSHFHGGVDISTFGKTGYPVYASREGSVVRISVSPYGYGKMLLLRHPDGFYTRYAHLKKFNSVIETRVRRLQKSKGIYPVEIQLPEGELYVEQGEVIAYTGNTGVGDAHLHFEILDQEMNPVNPLLFPQIASVVADKYPPEFRRLAFTPLTEFSIVNGTSEPCVVDVVKNVTGEYVCQQVVYVRGLIGLSVRASDQYYRGGYFNQCKFFACFLDDSLVFRSAINRVLGKDYRQSALHYDFDLYNNGELYFQKLYVEPGNRLPLYFRLPAGSGILCTNTLTPGIHMVRIVAYDEAKNSSVLIARIAVAHTEDPVLSFKEKFSQPARATEQEEFTSPTYDIRLPVKEEIRSSLTLSYDLRRDFLVLRVGSHLPFTLRPSLWLSTPSRRFPIDINAVDM